MNVTFNCYVFDKQVFFSQIPTKQAVCPETNRLRHIKMRMMIICDASKRCVTTLPLRTLVRPMRCSLMHFGLIRRNMQLRLRGPDHPGLPSPNNFHSSPLEKMDGKGTFGMVPFQGQTVKLPGIVSKKHDLRINHNPESALHVASCFFYLSTSHD